MSTYRIRQEVEYINNKASYSFIVEKRNFMYHWILESKRIYGMKDVFDNYSDAFLEVQKRKGNLIYITD